MTTPGNSNGSPVSPRELYSQLESIQAKLGAQIKEVQSTVEKKLTEMRADMDTERAQHRMEHQHDIARRSSLTRWTVTTLMSGLGVMVAIYVALRGAGYMP